MLTAAPSAQHRVTPAPRKHRIDCPSCFTTVCYSAVALRSKPRAAAGSTATAGRQAEQQAAFGVEVSGLTDATARLMKPVHERAVTKAAELPAATASPAAPAPAGVATAAAGVPVRLTPVLCATCDADIGYLREPLTDGGGGGPALMVFKGVIASED